MTPVTYIEFDLRAALAEAGMTQMQLAYATNRDQSQIYRCCNGVTPTPANAAKLAEALGLLRDDVREPIQTTVTADP
jgi:hypothetical protein